MRGQKGKWMMPQQAYSMMLMPMLHSTPLLLSSARRRRGGGLLTFEWPSYVLTYNIPALRRLPDVYHRTRTSLLCRPPSDDDDDVEHAFSSSPRHSEVFFSVGRRRRGFPRGFTNGREKGGEGRGVTVVVSASVERGLLLLLLFFRVNGRRRTAERDEEEERGNGEVSSFSFPFFFFSLPLGGIGGQRKGQTSGRESKDETQSLSEALSASKGLNAHLLLIFRPFSFHPPVHLWVYRYVQCLKDRAVYSTAHCPTGGGRGQNIASRACMGKDKTGKRGMGDGWAGCFGVLLKRNRGKGKKKEGRDATPRWACKRLRLFSLFRPVFNSIFLLSSPSRLFSPARFNWLSPKFANLALKVLPVSKLRLSESNWRKPHLFCLVGWYAVRPSDMTAGPALRCLSVHAKPEKEYTHRPPLSLFSFTWITKTFCAILQDH